MAIIDADTHVIETERTFEYIDEAEQSFKPFVVAPKGGLAGSAFTLDSPLRASEFWAIEGRIIDKRSTFADPDTPEASREASDISRRIAHMDELGADVHVLYPTLFLLPLTRRPEVEVTLDRSYNRWMADIWAAGKGRLRWMAVLPLMSMDKSLEELHWAKAHGACGVFLHGTEGEKRLSEPYFYPLYTEASKLNMPLCVHAAVGSFTLRDFFIQDGFSTFKLAVVSAFHDLVNKRVPEKFPDLRWGFVEATSQWVPYVMNDLENTFRVRFATGNRKFPGRELLRENHMYVTCQTTDDLEYVLEHTGDENLVIGSDYGHRDTASELLALRKLKDSGRLDSTTAQKILSDNPRRLYGL